MESENGWIMPDGKFIECAFNGHIRCAEDRIGIKEQELEKIAIKVQCMPSIYRSQLKNYQPHFFTEREKMTEEQLETIEKYCIHFGCRPPLDYFFQKNLHDMLKMNTETMLMILGKK